MTFTPPPEPTSPPTEYGPYTARRARGIYGLNARDSAALLVLMVVAMTALVTLPFVTAIALLMAIGVIVAVVVATREACVPPDGLYVFIAIRNRMRRNRRGER